MYFDYKYIKTVIQTTKEKLKCNFFLIILVVGNARKAPGYIDIGEHDDIISVELSEINANNMKSFLITQKHSTVLEHTPLATS